MPDAGPPAAEAAAMQPPPTLASLPDALHHLIGAHLFKRERLRVARTARAFLQPYAGTFSLFKAQDEYGEKRLEVLGRLLRRQERLVELHANRTAMIPVVASALAETGCGRHLKELRLHAGGVEDQLDDVCSSVLSLFGPAPGCLPALEALSISIIWPEPTGLGPFWAALAEGPSPRLRHLSLMLNDEDMDEISQLWSLVASALEQRRAHGCAGLAKFTLFYRSGHRPSWLTDGALTSRQRLWAVLLPTLEDLSDSSGNNFNRNPEFIDAVIQHGAPCVKKTAILRPIAPRCLSGLESLEVLWLTCSPDVGRALGETLEANASRGTRPLFPSLRQLVIRAHSDEGVAEVFEAIERTSAFREIERLSVFVPEAELSGVEPIAAAFAGGAFTCLLALSLCLKIGDKSFGTIMEAIINSPFAGTLEALTMQFIQVEDGGGFGVLGAAIGGGLLPALKELYVNLPMNARRMEDLVMPLTGTPALEALELKDCDGLSRDCLVVLAQALQEGKFGTRLRELRVGGDGVRVQGIRGITDEGAQALAGALRHGSAFVKRLETLVFEGGNWLSGLGREVLVRAAAAHCPALQDMLLGGRFVEIDQMIYHNDLVEEEDELVESFMITGYQIEGDEEEIRSEWQTLNDIMVEVGGRRLGVVRFSKWQQERMAMNRQRLSDPALGSEIEDSADDEASTDM